MQRRASRFTIPFLTRRVIKALKEHLVLGIQNLQLNIVKHRHIRVLHSEPQFYIAAYP